MMNTIGFALLLWFVGSVALGLWVAPMLKDDAGGDEHETDIQDPPGGTA